jgi:hypothetical protein
VAAKKEAFGDNSYFYRRELNLSTTPEFISDGVYYARFQRTTNAPGPPNTEASGPSTSGEDIEDDK